MKELRLDVKKQEDGWYLASTPNNIGGGIATEAQKYKTLKDKVREATHLFLSDGYHEELGLPRNPQIRLMYSEVLFNNPQAVRIRITAYPENAGYEIRSDNPLQLDLYHKDFDALRKMLLKEIQRQGQHIKHVELTLEEILRPKSIPEEKIPRSRQKEKKYAHGRN